MSRLVTNPRKLRHRNNERERISKSELKEVVEQAFCRCRK